MPAAPLAMLRPLLLAVFITGCLCQSKVLRSRRIGTEGQLVSRLLSEYDANTRPPVRGCVQRGAFTLCLRGDNADHSAILVITNIFINRVRWHDSRAEVDLYLRQQWEDGRLQYDVDTREGIEEVSIPLNRKIWVPDTYFSSGNELSKTTHRSAVVEPSGYVRTSEQRTLDVPVHFGTSFPFLNRKSFTLRLSSYNYPLEDIVYLWANSPPLVNPVEVSNDLLSGSVTFEEASAGDCVGNYTVGVFSCVDVTVTFSTSFAGSLCQWFLPTLLLKKIFYVFASWLHFWVPSSWSVPRTISAALPFFVFVGLFVFRGDLVQSSPGLSCWLTFCLVITFFSLLEYFLAICCIPRRQFRYLSNGHHEDHPMGSAPKEASAVLVEDSSRCATFRSNDGLDVVSRCLFPLVFLCYLIVYFLFLV